MPLEKLEVNNDNNNNNDNNIYTNIRISRNLLNDLDILKKIYNQKTYTKLLEKIIELEFNRFWLKK